MNRIDLEQRVLVVVVVAAAAVTVLVHVVWKKKKTPQLLEQQTLMTSRHLARLLMKISQLEAEDCFSVVASVVLHLLLQHCPEVEQKRQQKWRRKFQLLVQLSPGSTWSKGPWWLHFRRIRKCSCTSLVLPASETLLSPDLDARRPSSSVFGYTERGLSDRNLQNLQTEKTCPCLLHTSVEQEPCCVHAIADKPEQRRLHRLKETSLS
jgi:hypothetical protein